MTVLNAVDPTPEQIQNFLKGSAPGAPVYMLNLLKFKARATYKDSASNPDNAVSGRDAYTRYAAAFGAMLKDMNIPGVETVFGGNVLHQLIGQGGTDWDMCAIVRYPNAQTMFDTVSSDAYRKIHYHRKAGLEGQLLISCDGTGLF